MNVLKFLCFIKEKNYELLYNKSTQKETYLCTIKSDETFVQSIAYKEMRKISSGMWQ